MKQEIIQRLLDKKHITVEEAMTLMQTDTIPVMMPTQPVQPYNPNYPSPNIWYTTGTGATLISTKTTLND